MSQIAGLHVCMNSECHIPPPTFTYFIFFAQGNLALIISRTIYRESDNDRSTKYDGKV